MVSTELLENGSRMSVNMWSNLTTCGVVAVNSTDYVRILLENLRDGRVSVPLRYKDDSERTDRTGTTQVTMPSNDTGWLQTPFKSEGGDTPALVSFTSGTEGQPKAVLLTRSNLHDAVTRLTEAMQITGDIREYVGVPVYHSFGYARCRVVLNAGGAVYIPPKGFDLFEIQRMLKAGEINALSAVPSLLRIFLKHRHIFGDELQTIKWVEIGSQYMTGSEKSELRKALPNAKIVQHYGLTEASRATLLPIHDTPESKLEAIGRIGGSIQIRLNEAGCVEIKGPNVAKAIDYSDRVLELGPEAWLTTSDMGRIEDGYLYFEGRADDMINCSGIKIMPDLIEDYLKKAVPNPGKFAVVKWPDPIRGDGIMLALGPDAAKAEQQLLDAIAGYGRQLGIEVHGAVSVRHVMEFPFTETGKLQRKELIATLKEDTSDTTAEIYDEGTGQNIHDYLVDLLGQGAMDDEKSFSDLGGDSLNHLQMTLLLQSSLGNAPENWESLPIRDLEKLLEDAGDIKLSDFGAPPLPDGRENMNPKDISFWSLVREDYRTNDASIFHQGFLMLLVHRFGNWRMGVKWRVFRAPLTIIYRFLNKLTQLFFGIKLDYTVKVGRRVKLEHFGGMILGAREIGNDVFIRQNTTFGIRSTRDIKAKPVIGNFVDIGAGAVIVGDIKIGDNSVIGANSVIYSNIPPNSIAIGVPAKIIGSNPRQNPSPLTTEGT